MRMLAKITDPTTGVREEEYKTFESALGTLPAYGVALTSAMVGAGKLTPAGRKALLEQVQNVYDQRLGAYDSSVNYWNNQAKEYGLGSPVAEYRAPVIDKKTNSKEQIFDQIVSPESTAKSSSWITNLWNSLFK